MVVSALNIMVAKQQVKVLVIEDDRTIRHFAMESLASCREVISEKIFAVSASEGIEKFIQEKPDITFLDISLPDGNGLQILPLLLKKNPEAFIVMMTGSAVARDVREAKEKGAMGYILKPFNTKRFVDTVSAYCHYHEALQALPDDERNNADIVTVTKEEIAFIFEAQAEQEPTGVFDVLADWSVLFVDDYMVNRDNAQRHLQRMGCSLTIVDNGEQAKRVLEQEHYNMVFIDTDVPHTDTYQLINQLRIREAKQGMKTYVVGLLATPHEALENKWLEAGMHDMLVKPCRVSDLEDKMVKFARRYQEDMQETFVM